MALSVFTAACARRTAFRRGITLRFSVIVRVESGTLEDDSGTGSDQFFGRTSAFGAFSLSRIIHLMKIFKPVTAIVASIFVSWHCNPLQSISTIVIAPEEQTFKPAAHPLINCFKAYTGKKHSI